MHPHGKDEKGQPVLVKPAGDGAFKVIGGAGGKLNHLRLTGVRSEADYKETARRNQERRREEKKRQTERDRADGLLASKAAAREAPKAELHQHQAKFVETVAGALGWTQDEMRFPEEKFQNASPAAVKAAAQKARPRRCSSGRTKRSRSNANGCCRTPKRATKPDWARSS